MSWPTAPFDAKFPPLSDDDLIPGGMALLEAAFNQAITASALYDSAEDWWKSYNRLRLHIRQRRNRARRRRRRMAQRLGR